MVWTSQDPQLFTGQPVVAMMVGLLSLSPSAILLILLLADCAQALLRIPRLELNAQV